MSGKSANKVFHLRALETGSTLLRHQLDIVVVGDLYQDGLQLRFIGGVLVLPPGNIGNVFHQGVVGTITIGNGENDDAVIRGVLCGSARIGRGI